MCWIHTHISEYHKSLAAGMHAWVFWHGSVCGTPGVPWEAHGATRIAAVAVVRAWQAIVWKWKVCLNLLLEFPCLMYNATYNLSGLYNNVVYYHSNNEQKRKPGLNACIRVLVWDDVEACDMHPANWSFNICAGDVVSSRETALCNPCITIVQRATCNEECIFWWNVRHWMRPDQERAMISIVSVCPEFRTKSMIGGKSDSGARNTRMGSRSVLTWAAKSDVKTHLAPPGHFLKQTSNC